MMSEATRVKAYPMDDLTTLFDALGGYYDYYNQQLQSAMEKLTLTDPAKLTDKLTAGTYAKWCFTSSYLLMLNAWQWFLSGHLLAKSSHFPGQVNQMYYYAIFFASRSFLAAHMKGRWTVEIQTAKDLSVTKRVRRNVWLTDALGAPVIELSDPTGGEHEATSNWLCQVYSNWDARGDYPGVSLFQNDHKFHPKSREMFTYQLEYIAEELYSVNEQRACADGDLLHLYQGGTELDEFFPEACWSLQYMKMATNLHSRLLDSCTIAEPMKFQQKLLRENFLSYHKQTGLDGVIMQLGESALYGE